MSSNSPKKILKKRSSGRIRTTDEVKPKTTRKKSQGRSKVKLADTNQKSRSRLKKAPSKKVLTRSKSTVKRKRKQGVKRDVVKKLEANKNATANTPSILDMLDQIDSMKITFDKYDVDGDGCITVKEYAQMAIDKGTPAWLAEEMATNFFANHDVDGDGTISYEEYKASLEEAKITVSQAEHEFKTEQVVKKLEDKKHIIDHIKKGEAIELKTFTEPTDHWKDSFNKFDNDGDGELSRDEYVKFIMSQGTPDWLAEEMATTFFEDWDKDGDGQISFEEYAMMLEATKTVVKESEAVVALESNKDLTEKLKQNKDLAIIQDPAHWRDIFDEADADGNGELSKDEYQALLVSQGTPDFLAKPMTDALFGVWDKTGSGTIVYEEFRAMMKATTTAVNES